MPPRPIRVVMAATLGIVVGVAAFGPMVTMVWLYLELLRLLSRLDRR